jgi:rhodanese-related sulfurtransferase
MTSFIRRSHSNPSRFAFRRAASVVTVATNFRAFASAANKFGNITVKEAAELLQNKDRKYLDVRTEAEFQAGHVPGAVNVPVYFKDASGQFVPNANFLEEVDKALPSAKDMKMSVGCQSGKRSSAASEMLASAGYTAVDNVLGGFGEWCKEGLPVEK